MFGRFLRVFVYMEKESNYKSYSQFFSLLKILDQMILLEQTLSIRASQFLKAKIWKFH